jgi:hypothetical protein
METFEGLNWALLKNVKVIQRSYLTFSEFTNPIDFSSILIEIGQNFEEIPFTFESAGFWESEEITEAGSKFNKKIQLSIPKLRSEVISFLKNYENRLLAFLVTDMNDEMHLVYPLRMTRHRNIPGQATSSNATNVEFSGSWDKESLFVTDYSSG